MYDPANQNHMGMVSAQEIAHNWGDATHPCNSHSGSNYNLMALGQCTLDFNNAGMWIPSGSGATTAGYIRAAWGT